MIEKGYAVFQDGEFKGLVRHPNKAIELPNYNVLSEITQLVKVKGDFETGTFQRIDKKPNPIDLFGSALKKLKGVT